MKLLVTKIQMTAFTGGVLHNDVIRPALLRYQNWQNAWDGETFDFDLLPQKQQMKFFPELETMEAKRERLQQRLAEWQQEKETSLRQRSVNELKASYPSNYLQWFNEATELISNVPDAKRLCRLAGWLDLLGHPSTCKNTFGLASRAEVFIEALKLMQAEWHAGELYGRELTSSHGLQCKVTKFRRKGLKSLVNKQKNNKNAERFSTEAKAYIMQLYKDPQKFLPATVYREYLQWHQTNLLLMPLQAKYRPVSTDKSESGIVYPYRSKPCRIEFVNTETGEPIEVAPVCFESVRRFVKSYAKQREAAESRHGKKYNNDTYGSFVKTKTKHTLSLWSADDYWMNFWLTENGRQTTKRPVVYVIWCNITGVPLGFAVGARQNRELVQAAIYDAVSYCSGKIAFEVELDHFGRSKKGSENDTLENWIRGLFPWVSYRKNAHGKVAERFNSRMQDEHWRNVSGYLGNNIISKKVDGRRNEDLKDYPIISYAEIEQMFRQYRAWCWTAKFKDTNEPNSLVFQRKINPEARELNRQQLAHYFGEVRTVTIRRDTITLDIKKRQYIYAVPTLALLDDEEKARYVQQYAKVRVRVLLPPPNPVAEPDIEDMVQTVFLYGIADEENPAKDVFLMPIGLKPALSRAKVEQTEADKEILADHYRQKEWEKQYYEKLDQQQKETVETFEMQPEEAELVEANPYLASKLTGRFDSKELEAQAHQTANEERKSKLKPRFDSVPEPKPSEATNEERRKSRLGNRF